MTRIFITFLLTAFLAAAGKPDLEPTNEHDFLMAYKSGYEALEAKDAAAAEGHFRAAALVAGTNRYRGAAYVRLGAALEAQNRWADAAAAYQLAAKLPWEDRDPANLNQQPTISDALKRLDSICQRKLQDRDGQRWVCQEYLRFNKDNPNWQAEKLAKLGELWIDDGKMAEGIAAFGKAAAVPELDANRKSHVLCKLGQKLNRAKEYEPALAAFARVVALPGAHPHRVADSLRETAEIQERIQKDPEAARATYRKILTVDGARPDQRASACIRIGESFSRERQNDKAMAAYGEVFKLGDAPPNETAQAYDKIADCWRRQGKLDKALAAERQACAVEGVVDGLQADLYYRLAGLLRDTGDKQGAITALDKGLALSKIHKNQRQRLSEERAKLAAGN